MTVSAAHSAVDEVTSNPADETGQPGTSVVLRTQRGLESLYRVDTHLDVTDFLVTDEYRRIINPARTPREQLLVEQSHDDELGLALFLDPGAVNNLERNDPIHRLDHRNFDDFCLVVEGVSHFIYFALRAAADRSVSALELELQAEVDKFACCVLLSTQVDRPWGRYLYDDVRFASDLDDEEGPRYRMANACARRYAKSLSRRYLDADRLDDMLPELRRFYRMTWDDKCGHIDRVA